jgi:CRP-like cAMP-binding protein
MDLTHPFDQADMSAPSEPKLDKLPFRPGEVIFRQGDEGSAAFIVETGEVVIYQDSDGQRVELATIKHGEIFGEMAVIDSGRRMASAVAQTPVTLARIPRALFARKLESTDKFIRGILTLLLANIRNAKRIFQRRPRSFGDHCKTVRALGADMRRFANRQGYAESETLKEILGRFEAVLAELEAQSRVLKDRRHDVMRDGPVSDEETVSLFSTEGRR